MTWPQEREIAVWIWRIAENAGPGSSLETLSEDVKVEVLDLFDHANLNTLEAFRDRVTTTENVCVELWRIFSCFAESNEYPQVRLERIAIEETGNNSFEYFGEGAALRRTLV